MRVSHSEGFAQLLVLVIACATGCANNDHATLNASEKAVQDPVRITQFYATKPVAPRGEDMLLCYGVENASAVRITPQVEQLRPTLSRCFTVSPKETTTFTLTAEGRTAKAVTQSVTVTVTEPHPHFRDLSISATEVKPGQLLTFCFKADNAIAVRGGPGRLMSGSSPKNGCLADHPRRTTSYRITIEGAGGETDDARMTVKVQ